MTGSTLFETMAGQIAEECERNTSVARKEAESILAEARAQSAAQRTAMLEETQTLMEILDERWRLKGQAEAAKASLSMKSEAVEAVVQKVHEEIGAVVDGAHFEKVLDDLLVELMAVAEGDVVVLAPEAHTDHVRGWLEEHGRSGLTVEAFATLRDGVALQDPPRTYRVSNALGTRFSRVEQRARNMCMTSLFDGTEA